MRDIIDRTGEKHIDLNGNRIEIIEFFNSMNCTIRYDNGTIIKHKQYSVIKKGTIRFPFDKTVQGVGYTGIGGYSTKTNGERSKPYMIWQGILSRCYSQVSNKYHSAYLECFVADYWHNFQNFAKWYEENYIEDFQLDKDILFKGNKEYSEKTCCFVPREINIQFAKNNKNRGEYAIGVSYHNNKYEASMGRKLTKVHLGHYDTEAEAFLAYKKAKEYKISVLANKHKNSISNECYKTLLNYKVEITD